MSNIDHSCNWSVLLDNNFKGGPDLSATILIGEKWVDGASMFYFEDERYYLSYKYEGNGCKGIDNKTSQVLPPLAVTVSFSSAKAPQCALP